MPVGRQEDRDGRELRLPVGTAVKLSSEGGRNWAASVKHEQCLSFPDMGFWPEKLWVLIPELPR